MNARGFTALLIAAAVFSGGCAQEPLPQPSFLGLGDISAEAGPARANGGNDTINPALRHINSNRVLGAMAYQKVTGRSIDPESLVGQSNQP